MPSKAKELSENDIQEIIGLARRGYIAIVDAFFLDSDEKRRLAAARICEAVYESSLQRMRNGLKNNYIQIYLTKYTQDFIGDGQSDPCSRIYNKIAKDGEKLNIGFVYVTDMPSLIAPTMIAETKNFFVSISRLMHKDERDAVKRLKGFEDLVDSVRYAPRADHLYILTRSRPFVVPVQTAESYDCVPELSAAPYGVVHMRDGQPRGREANVHRLRCISQKRRINNSFFT